MYNNREIMETIRMIEEQNLDVRTITMGISLIDCMDTDIDKSCEKVYNNSNLIERTLMLWMQLYL